MCSLWISYVKPLGVGTMEKLNDERLWLRVSRLSDIVNEVGDKIEDWALYSPPMKSDIDWPTRRKPLPETFKLWRSTIRNVSCQKTGL